MRSTLRLFAVLLAAACSAGTDPVSLPVQSDFAFSKVNDPGRVDLIGSADLIVDSKTTQNHWVVRDEFLPADFCSVIEGGVTPGNRRLIRFTVTTPNIGDADVFVGSPLQHYLANDGLFELSTCHNHFHFKNYATYRLLDATGKVWKAAKRGFCMLDTDPNPSWMGEPPAGDRNFLNCGTLSRDGFQGISHGYADTYILWLGGQYFVLDGGDGQPVVPPGAYTIEIHVNPPYAPDANGNCPLVKDPATGQCHQFAESSYANNVGRAYINIPSHPGRDGYGPDKGSTFKVTKQNEIDHSDIK